MELPEIVEVPDSLKAAIAIPEGLNNPRENMEGVLEAVELAADEFISVFNQNTDSTGLMVIPNGGLLPTILLIEELKTRDFDLSNIPICFATTSGIEGLNSSVKNWFTIEDMYDEGTTYVELKNRLANSNATLHMSVLTTKEGRSVPQEVIELSPGIITLPNKWILSYSGLNSAAKGENADPVQSLFERNCTIPLVKIGDGVNQGNLEAYKNFLREHQHFAVDSSEFELMLQIESTPDLVEKRNLFMQYLGFIQEA